MQVDFDEETAILKRALAGQASRAEIIDLIQKFAIGEQQPGESIESAEARFLATPGGARLYSFHETAPLEAPAAVDRAAEVMLSKAEQSLDTLAKRLVDESKGSLSYARAYRRVAMEHPELFSQAVA